jgi:uncharacterized DUF497 family protein
MGSQEGSAESQSASRFFERAATIFLDPLALSEADEEHSQKEQRWITMGLDGRAQCLSSRTRSAKKRFSRSNTTNFGT